MIIRATHLRPVLIGLLVSMQLVTVAVMMQGAAFQTRERLQANARHSLIQHSDSVAERTRSYLGRASQTATLIAEITASGHVDVDDNAELTHLFVSLLKSHAELRNIHIGRDDGSFLLVTRSADGDAFEFHKSQLDADGILQAHVGKLSSDGEQATRKVTGHPVFDPRERLWSRPGSKTEGVLWTEPYTFDQSAIPGMTAAVVLQHEEGEPVGVLGLDIDLTILSTYLADITSESASAAVLLDASDHVIAYSGSYQYMSRGHHGLLHIDDTSDEKLQAILAAYADNGDVDVRVAPLGDPAGAKQLAMVSSVTVLDKQPERPWKLLVMIPMAQFDAGLIESIDNKTWMLLMMLACSTLLGAMVLLKVTRPIARLIEDATIDSLTGALNRRAFESRLNELLETRSSTEENELILVALDLDGFKPINDRFGHAVGDVLLQAFVKRLRHVLRADDLIARTGGDEFIVTLLVDHGCNVTTIVERLREHAVGRPIKIAGRRHRIGVTAGVTRHREGELLQATLERADMALISGKAIEKNRCYLADSGDGSQWSLEERPTVSIADAMKKNVRNEEAERLMQESTLV